MKKPKLLIVDDEPLKLHCMRTLLTGMGYDVQTATDGAPALAMMEREKFDGVILDLCMPDHDGWWTLRAMREQHIRLPVAVVSCYPLEDAGKERLENLGITLFHNDTLNLKTLWEVANRLLKKDVNYGRQRMERIAAVSLGSLATFGTAT